jgi:hypothetical protein
VQAEFEGAKAALNDLTRTVADVLVSTEKGSASDIIGERVGREGLMAELEAEMLCYTPEELIQIAESEERWCLSELRQASQELGFKDDWHSALEHVKKQYVSPGQQTQLVNELLAEGIAFVKNHDLVTVPLLAEETWRMFMLSPEDQKASPFFLGGDSMFVAYPTDAMDYDSKLMSMRGNNRHFSRAEVFHEMIPGHLLGRRWRNAMGVHLLGYGVLRQRTRQDWHTFLEDASVRTDLVHHEVPPWHLESSTMRPLPSRTCRPRKINCGS